MPDETVTAPPKAASKPGLTRLIAIILTALTVAAGAVAFLELPKMLKATQTSALVRLMAQVNRTQQGLATEYNEVVMSGATKTLPDEGRTNQLAKELADAAKGVDLDGLELANDTAGRQANLLLTDPNGQVAQARKTAYEGRTDVMVADFQSLIADGWTIQAAIVKDLDGLNQQLAKQAGQFVADCRDLPMPIIDPTGLSADPHQEIIGAIASPADRDANSSRLFGWGSIALTTLLALAAIGLWVASVMKSKKRKPAADVESAVAKPVAVTKPVAATKATAEPAALASPAGPRDPAKTSAPPMAKPPAGAKTPPRPGGIPARPASPGLGGPRPGLKAPAPSPAGQGGAAGAAGTAGPARPGLRPPVSGQTPVRPAVPPATAPLRPSVGASPSPVKPASVPPAKAASGAPLPPEATKPTTPGGAKPRIPWRTTGAKEDQDKE